VCRDISFRPDPILPLQSSDGRDGVHGAPADEGAGGPEPALLRHGTVRNWERIVIQFTYGDDGLNPAVMEDGDGTAGKVKSQKKKVRTREGGGGAGSFISSGQTQLGAAS
jgi:hypothetical protein